jgi:hypothetical protein
MMESRSLLVQQTFQTRVLNSLAAYSRINEIPLDGLWLTVAGVMGYVESERLSQVAESSLHPL